MKRLLLLGHRPWPNDHALLESVFARRLPGLGYEPVWLMQPACPELAGTRDTWHGTPVHVTPRRHWRGPRRHHELLTQYLSLGDALLRERAGGFDFDFIQARTGLPELLAAARLARRFSLPFVYQCSFPSVLARRLVFQGTPGLRLLAPLTHAFEQALVQRLLRRAALNLAVSEEMARGWRAAGIPRVAVLPLGADVSPEPEAAAATATPSETVVYFGSMEPRRRLELLLEAFVGVRAQRPNARLLMLGDAAGSGLPARTAALGLREAVTFAGRVPREDVPRHVRTARCSVAPIPPEPLYVVSSATKVVESLGLGVPVVANREIPDQRELIERSGGGLLPEYTAAGFTAALVELLRGPEAAAARGAAGRRFVLAHRSYDVLARELAAEYDRMLESARR